MDYSLRLILNPLTGGVGIVGRFVMAMAILAVLKFMDKEDRDVDKGIKKLLIGRAVVILLVIIAIALVTGMYIMGFSLPLWYFFD